MDARSCAWDDCDRHTLTEASLITVEETGGFTYGYILLYYICVCWPQILDEKLPHGEFAIAKSPQIEPHPYEEIEYSI